MSETTQSKKLAVGIKNIKFTQSGTNGESHRRNARTKALNRIKNARARAELYATRSSVGAHEWHSKLNGISSGTV
jgi:uncharacterized protein YggE